MTKSANRPVRYLFTRVATAGSAVGAFVALWVGVAATAPASSDAGQSGTAAEDAVIEQDGWRWDPVAQQWVAIDPQPTVAPAAAAATAQPQQVIVVERQPIYYYYNYVTEVVAPGKSTPGAASVAATKPSAGTTPDAPVSAVTTGQPSSDPAAGSAIPASMPAPALPPAAPASGPASSAPAAPAPAPAPAAPAPAPAPAPAAAPAAPPPPKPAPAAPKATKAS